MEKLAGCGVLIYKEGNEVGRKIDGWKYSRFSRKRKKRKGKTCKKSGAVINDKSGTSKETKSCTVSYLITAQG